MKTYLLSIITYLLLGSACFAQEDITAPPYFLEFMEKNPKKFHLTYYDNLGRLIKWQDNELSSIGGMVYWLYALEYVRQIENGNFSPTERVPLKDISKFDASSNKMSIWSDYLHQTKRLLNNKVRMREIVSGLLTFTNDANGDYLMSRLGVDSLTSAVQTFKMYNTTALFPISSAIIYAHNPFQENENTFINRVNNENLNEFRAHTFSMYDTLINDHSGLVKESFKFRSDKHKKYATLLTDRLPMGIVSDYNLLLQKINERTIFEGDMATEWEKTVEAPLMTSKIIQEHYKHCGRLVYSTVNSVSITLYGTFKDGRRVQMSATFENLTETEHIDLALSINDFGFSMLENKEYMEQVKRKIDLIGMKGKKQ
ncbi:hypothetical protein EI427_03790 [Flammeovirga pectinis]|uniref:Serine hydrolase n=1 Tax=Flammeovirga pectinis TaxID=2494373 RepID=A0A3Q9FM53_9BACT|nr:hypothetical protein [Flammeovirga pectinis]AZQ61374.1 hypothetical protein EI427_03790 [Flammeovirga pectinis]